MSNVPKLRFKEFSGEWEEKKLGNLVDIKSGISPSAYNLTESGTYPFLKVEDLNNCDKYQIISRQYSEDIKNLIPRSSVIFPKRGAAILLNKVRVNLSEVLMDSNLMAITPNKNISVEFLYYKIIKDELFRIADTSTIPQINNKHIIPYKVTIPS
ncbi:restriction endonuclease subunit S, partial [Aliarcobacter butzleri]